jgi:hypothetical protein
VLVLVLELGEVILLFGLVHGPATAITTADAWPHTVSSQSLLEGADATSTATVIVTIAAVEASVLVTLPPPLSLLPIPRETTTGATHVNIVQQHRGRAGHSHGSAQVHALEARGIMLLLLVVLVVVVVTRMMIATTAIATAADVDGGSTAAAVEHYHARRYCTHHRRPLGTA